jgi:SAM-dependent methyltransferase
LGELFRRGRPESTLAWTGERLVSELGGEIESEHLHRYFLARELCRGKVVLDVASGEGYGTALLAQTASRATGVEIDAESVLHASRAYQSANLEYLEGNATQLPLEAASVDIVVSFETLEHFLDHDLFLREVQRVLRPGGVLVISTPDADVYSRAGTTANPFHVRELTRTEFVERLQTSFCNVSLFHQRIIGGSVIFPDSKNLATGECWIYENRGADTFESHRDLPYAPYLIALASNSATGLLSGVSLYVHQKPEERVELERLRNLEAAYREQEPKLQKELKDAAGTREEAARLASVVSQLQPELERLRSVEAAYREQEPRIRQELDAAAAIRGELERLRSVEVAYREQELRIRQELAAAAVQGELERLRSVETAYREQELKTQQGNAATAGQAEVTRMASEVDHLAQSLEEANEQCRNQQEQLDNSVRRSREQLLVMARLQHQLGLEIQNAQSLRDTIGQQETAYKELRQQLHNKEIACQEQTHKLREMEILYREQVQKFRDTEITYRDQTQRLRQLEKTLDQQELVQRERLQKIREMETTIGRLETANSESARRCVLLSGDLDVAKAEAAKNWELSQNLAKLVFPVWMRKLVPSGLRPAARSLKRIIRPGGSQSNGQSR